MTDAVRKKSPRAPSMPLEEAIARVMRVYEKERRHPAPTDVVAQHMGYRSANNGAALSAIASVRYYGLLERPSEGKLAVTKDVESYSFNPSEAARSELLVKWLKSPPVFGDLLEQYQGNLPSEATIRYDLIQRGFSPIAAESVLSVFLRSVQFARYFDRLGKESGEAASVTAPAKPEANDDNSGYGSIVRDSSLGSEPLSASAAADRGSSDLDRIPVRLSGNRRAYLLIPTPFYGADKSRLKAQIDLLLTDDEAQSEMRERS
jgi:hypothetical protein